MVDCGLYVRDTMAVLLRMDRLAQEKPTQLKALKKTTEASFLEPVKKYSIVCIP